MASAQAIQDLVSSYLSNDISAIDLANRFAPLRKAAIRSEDGAAKNLAIALHGHLSYYFHSLISEDALRECLSSLKFVEVTIAPGYQAKVTIEKQKTTVADRVNEWAYAS